jgi:hypothetical protein
VDHHRDHVLSRETLELCESLLKASSLQVGADDFDDVARRVMTAKREIALELRKPAPADHRPPARAGGGSSRSRGSG